LSPFWYELLVDAQLPRRLATLLQQAGYDALHTLDLPLGNHTPDRIINELSIEEERVVVTMDADFVDSYLVSQIPWKLLLVSTGNIRNDELMALFELNLAQLVEGFDLFDFIEVNQREIIFHS
jgi:predicted nuclease of predicted toxin-antitoxin system